RRRRHDPGRGPGNRGYQRSRPRAGRQAHRLEQIRRRLNRRDATVTERVVLAYSGGLDTSVAIGWIADQTGAEVIAVAIDVGQGGEDLDVIRQRALDCGAVEAVIVDARADFAEEFCVPALRANAR